MVADARAKPRQTLTMNAVAAIQQKLAHQTMLRSGTVDLYHPPLMLRRWSRRRRMWDGLSMIYVTIQAACLLYVAYETHKCTKDVTCYAEAEGTWLSEWRSRARWLEEAGTAVFVVDILINFRTGYVEADGTEVIDPWLAAIRYLTTWFLVDLLCVLPLDRIGGSLLAPSIDLIEDNATGMRRLLSHLSRHGESLRRGWRRVRESRAYRRARLVVQAPTAIRHRQRIRAVGVARLVRLVRVLKRLGILRVLKEAKVLFSFVGRVWHSQRFVRQALALTSLCGSSADKQRQQEAASLIQTQLRRRLAQNFALKLEILRHRRSKRESGQGPPPFDAGCGALGPISEGASPG